MDKQHQTEKEKEELEQQSSGNTVDTSAEDGVVYLVNDDGTPFDTSDGTYVSVDLPEEGTDQTSSADEKSGS